MIEYLDVTSTPLSFTIAVKSVVSESSLNKIPLLDTIEPSYTLLDSNILFISLINEELICDSFSTKLSKIVLHFSESVKQISCSVIRASKYKVGLYSASSIVNVSPISASIYASTSYVTCGTHLFFNSAKACPYNTSTLSVS